MAHPVRFRNSLLLLVLLAACHRKKAVIIPDVYVQAGDTGLGQHEGYLYYHNRKFSGRTIALYANRDTAFITPYYNGREEGWCTKWYGNGKKMEERFYVAGRKENQHKGWWPDGQLKFDYRFSNDEHEGEAKEWFSNGRPFRIFHYAKGHEDGLQQMWWEDGAVRANYVVKDGRQYGLIGRKLCINNDTASKL